jgi:hypothetical protein
MPVAASIQKAGVTHQTKTPKLRNLPKAKPEKRVKRRKERKSVFRKFAEEAFDLVEDIFD